MNRYDLKIVKTIVETIQAVTYVDAVMAAEFALSKREFEDSFAAAEADISDVHEPDESNANKTKAPATQSEALAALNAALEAVKATGLLSTLEQNCERITIDGFYQAVGDLSIQFSDFLEAVGTPVPNAAGSLCCCHTGEWSGSPNPENPDGEWVCDACNRVIKAEPRKTGDSMAVWKMLHQEAAQREGWFLSECSGSAFGPWQIQKIDHPEDNVLLDGMIPPELEDDDQAMQIVANGMEDNHVFAREHLKAHCPQEYERIVAMKACAVA